jgi:hypothetical protein
MVYVPTRMLSNLRGLDHASETRLSAATLAKSAPLWGQLKDKYSQSLWVIKIARLTALGNSLSDSLGFLFFAVLPHVWQAKAQLRARLAALPRLQSLPTNSIE